MLMFHSAPDLEIALVNKPKLTIERTESLRGDYILRSKDSHVNY